MKDMVRKVRMYPKQVLETATAMTNMTLEQNYQLYFLALKAYASGLPDKKAKLVWHSLIQNVVDNESTCDDVGFEGMKIKDRCKLIGKEKKLSPESISWIEKELKPYFADSLRKQKSDLGEFAFKHIVSGDISSEEAAPFYEKFTKRQSFLNRIKK